MFQTPYIKYKIPNIIIATTKGERSVFIVLDIFLVFNYLTVTNTDLVSDFSFDKV